ncbi:ScbA/BarX family gamma-butyrolactone biosynthesis protein [Streptomyces sp. YU58]|uniref:ScbA/BarX family gamma-butyrolactone biosynthesis protein n=1 Tax=Streptomyces sp. SX92 TaxID=3158972 RepID=UPI0027B96F32|nr:ScbA/BarX family gamma-butyrolactone biosynthesis protein [Streptomyces coralus]WLW51506.1 ScbA/BarX family gamma-butyrolactone biosynthesis protein [Streptomyces coralus]
MHVVPPLAPHSEPGLLRHPWTGLCFESRVPRASVHKSAASEVLLTDAVPLGGNRYTLASAWHRDGFLGHLGSNAADPLLLAETVRQAAILLSHRFHDIPYGHPFVLGELALDLDAPLPPADPEPLALRLDAHCARTGAHPRRTNLEAELAIATERRRLGSARVRWEVMEPRRYAVLRKRGAADNAGTEPVPEPAGAVPVPPARLGRRQDRDVLLAADSTRPDRWWLRLDLDHPVLFDHPSDHVPGMALTEAFRQAAALTAADVHGIPAAEAAHRIRALDTAFASFGELNLPVSITARPADDDRGEGGHALLLRAEQSGRELASARVVLAAPRADHRTTGAAC